MSHAAPEYIEWKEGMSPEEWNREVGSPPGKHDRYRRFGDEPTGSGTCRSGLPPLPGHPRGWSACYVDAGWWLVNTEHVAKRIAESEADVSRGTDRYMSFQEAVKAAEDLGPEMCCGITRAPAPLTQRGSHRVYEYYLGMRLKALGELKVAALGGGGVRPSGKTLGCRGSHHGYHQNAKCERALRQKEGNFCGLVVADKCVSWQYVGVPVREHRRRVPGTGATEQAECSQDPLEAVEEQLAQQRQKAEEAIRLEELAKSDEEISLKAVQEAQLVYQSKMEATKVAFARKNTETDKLAVLEETVVQLRKERKAEELARKRAAAKAAYEAQMAAFDREEAEE